MVVIETDAGRPAYADFEEYAQARQRTLLRAAFLVCGDGRRAQELLQSALLTLARHWDQVRHEQPDMFVRRTLYRDAIRSCRRGRPDTSLSEPVEEEPDDSWPAEEVRRHLDVALSEPVWEVTDDAWAAEEVRLRREVERALEALTPTQRAVVVLLHFDDCDERDTAHVLGCSVGTVRADEQDAVAALRGALPSGRLGGPTSQLATDLKDLLELASDALPLVDIAQGTWEEARRRHTAVVRRTVLGIGAMAAAGVALTVVLREPPPDRSPLPVDTATPAAADGRLTGVEVGGVSMFLAPDPRSEVWLPRYPGADELAIPRLLGPGDPSTWAVLGEGGLRGVSEPVRAVFLVGTSDGAFDPVLYVPGARAEWVRVTGMEVDADPMADHPRAIADDRHRVVFIQGNRLAVLDARDGSVVEMEVPEPTMRTAGWTRDGTRIIAHGRYDSWIIDPGRRRVRRAGGPVYADWADLSAGDQATLRRTFSRTGEMTGGREVRGPLLVPNGASVADPHTWVAASAYLPGDYQRATQRTQGLVAVDGALAPTPHVLAAAQSELVPDRCYSALAWGPEGVVLLESRSVRPGFEITVRRVLAWDVLGARLWLVAHVDREAEGVDGFSGYFAA